jgi:membrane peptidoglycan carboxypeptidase
MPSGGGPMGPGGPRGPGGPYGPGPGGPDDDGPDQPSWRNPRMPFGRGRPGEGGDAKKTAAQRSKMARRRNILIASFAVLIMLTGAGFVGGTYYVDSVKAPSQLNFPETTMVYYSDGSLLAKLGEVTRYEVKYDEMNSAVTQSIVASEDKTFWTNSGVDFTGVMRAAWNNVTGGAQQGGSTITQQYARVAFELSGSTYSRKLREAVLAWKIGDSLSKQQILEYYLNSVPFGRQTYGIEAAAQAFFGKTVKKTAPPEQQITVAEAMALVLMVKQPNPDPADPKGQPGYDPTYSPEAEQNSRGRWEYVRQQMLDLKYLTPEQNAKLVYPKASFKPYNPNASNGVETPVGLVINHVLSELTHSPTSQFKGWAWKDIKEGGYKIYTTIDPGAQKAAETAADSTVGGSGMFGQPANLQDALVAVEPGTGKVLAYYGGHDGKGADYGGFYYDEKNVATGVGRFPPGSSFKVYTLAAALKSGISLNSYWQWTPHDMQGRTGTNQIRNASTCPSDKSRAGACSLLESTIQSLNVPFYGLTVSVTPAKVLEMARDAGIDYMWTDKRVRQDLTQVKDMSQMTPGKFDTILGIGQYPVTVMDHANGLATFAANGLRAQAHFVVKVTKGDAIVYGETLPKAGQQPIMNQQAINDLDYALSKITSASIKGGIGWDTAGKTGTWEYNNSTTENGNAWMVGYSKKIAAAVWVGNKDKEQALKDKYGKTMWGSTVPATIWQSFMANATKAMNKPKVNTKFNPPSFIGNENPPGSAPSPTPAAPPPGQDPNQPTLPPTPGNGNGNGNGGLLLGPPRQN